jgi:flavoprotein
MLTLDNVDLYLSKAGEEVLKWYNYELSDLKKRRLRFSKMLHPAHLL